MILNHNKGAYYGLNEVGVLVWDALEKGPQTMDALCEAVSSEYEVDMQTCRDDINDLLSDLISEKLVEEVQ